MTEQLLLRDGESFTTFRFSELLARMFIPELQSPAQALRDVTWDGIGSVQTSLFFNDLKSIVQPLWVFLFVNYLSEALTRPHCALRKS